MRLKLESNGRCGNKIAVLAAVDLDGDALRYASDELRRDKEVVLTAVNQNGRALEFASDELRRDKEVVLAAVNQNGRALEFASIVLRRNKEVVLAAVRQNGKAINCASNKLRKHKKVVLAAVSQNYKPLELLFKFHKNKEVILAAVYDSPRAFEYASQNLKNNKKFVLALISVNPLILEFASERLQNDKEIVLAAVRQKFLSLNFASQELQGEFIKFFELLRQLEIIKKKAQTLEERGYKTAAASAFKLYESISEHYIHLDCIEEFKTKCVQAIKEARLELEKHRGWKQILGNLLLALGLNIFYLPAIMINKLTSGNFLFFKTDSAKKVDILEKNLYESIDLDEKYLQYYEMSIGLNPEIDLDKIRNFKYK